MSPPQTDLRTCKGINYLSFLFSEPFADFPIKRSTPKAKPTPLTTSTSSMRPVTSATRMPIDRLKPKTINFYDSESSQVHKMFKFVTILQILV